MVDEGFNVRQTWVPWAAAEGLSKTASRALQKISGLAAGSVAGTLFITIVIGFVQFLAGFVGALATGVRLAPSKVQVVGPLIFGVFATVSTIFSLWAFTDPSADVGIATFLTVTSIVPGALLDRLWFGNRFALGQIGGIALFLFAGWAMFNFPNVSILQHFPLWGLLSLGSALTNALGEALTRRVAQEESPNVFVNNGWVGLSTIVTTLVFMAFGGFGAVIAVASGSLLFLGVGIGVIVLAMISFKLKAYVGGEATIAFKKLVMQSVYLATAVIMGWIFFGEAMTLGKVVGIIGFCAALIFTDKNAWGSLRLLVLSKTGGRVSMP
jgi:drug/metabolite transporter (DMT)-like permease